MKGVIKTIIDGNKFELLLDTNIFNKDIILKTSYNFLDKGFFFFLDNDKNILIQFTNRINNNLEKLINDFYEELLSVKIREKLNKDNKKIREKIIKNSFFGNVEDSKKDDNNQIDFDKDIEDILKEIENDPDLKIDEAEIEKILKEIEEESN